VLVILIKPNFFIIIAWQNLYNADNAIVFFIVCFISQAIRVLGVLGALDPYKHKLHLGQIKMGSDSGAVLSMSETKPDSETGQQGKRSCVIIHCCACSFEYFDLFNVV